MPAEGLPTSEEARQELTQHLADEEKRDPDFWKKHDQRLAKEKPGEPEKPKK